MAQQIEQRSPDLYGVIGKMGFENASALEKEGFELIDGVSDRLVLDFSKLDHASSVGAAILLSWLRYALRQGKGIEYHNLTEQFRNVIEISDLMEILPVYS